MRITAIIAIVVVSTALSAAAQSAPDAKGDRRLTLRGVLVDAGSGGALPRARLHVMSGRANIATVLADAEGSFSVGVPAGTALSIRIVKAGYASILVPVPPRQSGGTDPLRIEVPRGAVIAGRAIDASGEPALRVAVRRVTSGGTRWASVGPDGVMLSDNLSSQMPDDRGEYRIGGLVAGRYVIDAYPALTVMTIGPSGLSVQGGTTSPFQTRSVTVDLQAGSEATIDLMLERRPFGSLPADPAPDPPGSTIRGTVTTTAGLPVSDATVSAHTSSSANFPGPGSRTTRTDTFGRFTLRGIGAGSIVVRAFKRGYVQSQHGQRGGELPGLPLKIEAGRDVDDVSIVLPRTGAISGLVTDEYGEPQEAGVQLVRVRREPTGALVGIREQNGPVQRTDDRGQFRLSGVLPGEYVVMALLPAETVDPAAAVRTVYRPAYYPDTPDFASAAPIRIVDGEEIPGLILTMRRVPVARVTGVAHTSQGQPVTGTLRLMSRHAVTIGNDARVLRPGPDGEFAFADVPPGEYLLRTLVDSGPSASEFSTSYVTVVDRDPEPVMIRTTLGSRLSGRIVLEGGSGQMLWGYSASSVALDSASSPGSVSNTGPISTGEPFALNALAGPTRLRVWSDDQNWYLKSILINGFDVVDSLFDFGFDGRTYSDVEVVFSRVGATIAGRATNDRAAPVRDYAVYVFSTDRERWFANSRWVRVARAAADGGFTASSLAPGEYWVVAVDRVDASSAPDWVDTELLTMLSSRATRVTLGEGQSQSVALRVINR